ncbi:MAG: hypothetical protein ACLQGP_25035 [Isosphaeraceae bacterium]
MEKIVVVSLGVEGGGATIYGEQTGTLWSFWQEGSSLCLDENDDEAWSNWRTEPVSDLEQALPDGWLMMFPIKLHPEFLPWFRAQYEGQRKKLPAEHRRIHDEHVASDWLRILHQPETSAP